MASYRALLSYYNFIFSDGLLCVLINAMLAQHIFVLKISVKIQKQTNRFTGLTYFLQHRMQFLENNLTLWLIF